MQEGLRAVAARGRTLGPGALMQRGKRQALADFTLSGRRWRPSWRPWRRPGRGCTRSRAPTCRRTSSPSGKARAVKGRVA